MIQYPKNTHVTLPSVESWGANMNILRDPPRSMTTRRVDKPLQTSLINEMIDGSGDRINEYINVYQRGVNPSVSIEYSNVSNLGGSNVMVGNNFVYGQPSKIPVKSASLPYKTMDNGAFRPPIRSQRDLVPISRQPRAWFNMMTKPGFADYTKSKHEPTKFRMIKDLLSVKDVKPNKSFKLEKPIVENFKMMESINDKHINVGAGSGTRTLTKFDRDAYEDMQHAISDATLQYNLESADSSKYIKPGKTYIEADNDILLDRNVPVYNMLANKSDYRVDVKSDYDNEVILDRNVPVYETRSNIAHVGVENFDSMNMSSRNYSLPQTTTSKAQSEYQVYNSAGHSYKPQFEKEIPQASIGSLNHEKERIRNYIYSQQQSRYGPAYRA